MVHGLPRGPGSARCYSVSSSSALLFPSECNLITTVIGGLTIPSARVKVPSLEGRRHSGEQSSSSIPSYIDPQKHIEVDSVGLWRTPFPDIGG